MSQETIVITLANAEKTAVCGRSLAHTLHLLPLTILLDGELGAGKTTFLQAFGQELGITEPITSPTFALEQRYGIPGGQEFLHIDLYRLDTDAARKLIHTTDDHQGIRCIEWAKTLSSTQGNESLIRINLQEEKDGRVCEIRFEDIAIPTQEDIDQWREDVLLPPHIAAHCDTVARICDTLCAYLLKRGTAVRPLALHRSAQLHDLFRFLDLKPNAGPPNVVYSPEQETLWQHLRTRFAPHHEEACAHFLRTQGFSEIASIVETHGLRVPPATGATIEQQLLYYADKRAAGTRIVTIQERCDDLAARYAGSIKDGQVERWIHDSSEMEKRLFPEGAPLL